MKNICKLLSAFLLSALLLWNTVGSAQTTSRPTYPLKFRFINGSGQKKDTILTRLAFKYFSKSPSYPSYLKWKGLPFAVLRSPINGVGLFTDSASSFNSGDTIGIAYYKVAGTGRFDVDYYQSNIGSFMNDNWRKVGCRSHFFIREGKVDWV